MPLTVAVVLAVAAVFLDAVLARKTSRSVRCFAGVIALPHINALLQVCRIPVPLAERKIVEQAVCAPLLLVYPIVLKGEQIVGRIIAVIVAVLVLRLKPAVAAGLPISADVCRIVPVVLLQTLLLMDVAIPVR